MYSSQLATELESNSAAPISLNSCTSAIGKVSFWTALAPPETDRPKSKPSIVFYASPENTSGKATYQPVRDDRNQPTHGESLPLSAAAAPCEGVGQMPLGRDRLAKQQEHHRQTLTSNWDEGSRFSTNNPLLCGKYTYRRYQLGLKVEFEECFSLTCRNPGCVKKWSEREHNILAQSFLTKPPKYYFTIALGKTPRQHEYSKWMTSLHGKNKYRDKDFAYYFQVEIGEAGNFHIHYLARTNLDIATVKDHIKTSFAVGTNVNSQAYYGDEGLSRYFTKDMKHKPAIVLPPFWNRKRLQNESKNFLAASRSELSRRAIQGFAAKSPRKGNEGRLIL